MYYKKFLNILKELSTNVIPEKSVFQYERYREIKIQMQITDKWRN